MLVQVKTKKAGITVRIEVMGPAEDLGVTLHKPGPAEKQTLETLALFAAAFLAAVAGLDRQGDRHVFNNYVRGWVVKASREMTLLYCKVTGNEVPEDL